MPSTPALELGLCDLGDAEGYNEPRHTPAQGQLLSFSGLDKAGLSIPGQTNFYYFHVGPDSCGLAWQGGAQTE